MTYSATVLPVMIASPSDVLEYRAIAREVLHEWNYVHSTAEKVVLMPVGWETHSSPDLSSPAQDLINERILEHCDLLVGIFWTRLGTPTANATSGSAEEIQRHVGKGKPALVYFSSSPAALETVDATQYAALKTFRVWCEAQGLVEYIDNLTDFQWKFRRHLQITLNDSPYLKQVLGETSAFVRASETSGRQGPPSIASLASQLSPESRHLLLEASEDREGTIQHTALFSGPLVEANGQAILTPKDRESETLWAYMLPQLFELGLIVSAGHQAPRLKLYKVTPLGRDVARYMREGMK
jgi:hypothetical protein